VRTVSQASGSASAVALSETVAARRTLRSAVSAVRDRQIASQAAGGLSAIAIAR
jgi:hypothetical protein